MTLDTVVKSGSQKAQRSGWIRPWLSRTGTPLRASGGQRLSEGTRNPVAIDHVHSLIPMWQYISFKTQTQLRKRAVTVAEALRLQVSWGYSTFSSRDEFPLFMMMRMRDYEYQTVDRQYE